MADPSSVVLVAKGVHEVFKLAKKEGYLDKIVNFFKKKHKVLVLGVSGTGKTNFLKSLKEYIPEAIDSMNRTVFNEKHSIAINKNPFIFVDTPGEAPRSTMRKEAIIEALKSSVGIINVVSYGYHEYRTGIEEVIKNGNEVKTTFLKKQQNYEIDALLEWKEILGGQENIKWIMTIVTKADLWWDNKNEILDYYAKHNYARILHEAGFKNHFVIPYCSVIHKFHNVVPVSGLFDDKERLNLKLNLVDKLLESIGKSKLKEMK